MRAPSWRRSPSVLLTGRRQDHAEPTVRPTRRRAGSAPNAVVTDAGGAFGASLHVEAAGAVLRVQGAVDRSTARVVEQLVQRNRSSRDLTADLTEVSSIEPDGLAAILAALRDRPDPHTSDAPTRRSTVVLEVGVLEQLVASGRSGLFSEIAAKVTRIGAVPANTAVVDGALRLVTILASETLEGADGVSVSLKRHGRLTTVAASNDTVLEMDSHQYAAGEGPCISAAEAGCWFHSPSLAEESRWASFVPLAMAQGIESILSTPLLAGAEPVGALNIYSNRPRVFGNRQEELAELFAAQASVIVEDAGVHLSDEEVDERVLGALRSRERIAQAQGVLMARHHVGAEEALELIRRAARSAGTTVLAEADALLGSATGSPPDPDRD